MNELKLGCVFCTKLLPFELGDTKLKSLYEKWSSCNWLFCAVYVQEYTKHSKCNGHYYFNTVGTIQYFLILSVYQLVSITYKDWQETNLSILNCPIVSKYINFFAESFMLLLIPSKDWSQGILILITIEIIFDNT